MIRNWFKGTIARKLILAFVSVFLFTYIVTSLVVQGAVRTALTDSQLMALSQLAHLKMNDYKIRFDQLSVDLRAWSKLDVMNDLISNDVDKRVARTLINLKNNYELKGQLYAFNSIGKLVASSDPRQQKVSQLPEEWKSKGQVNFVNKHINPMDGDEIVALVVPIQANFLENYHLGTLVLAYHWIEITAALPEQSLLLYHPAITALKNSLPDPNSHPQSLVLLDSTFDTVMPSSSLVKFSESNGWTEEANKTFLTYSFQETAGLLSGWEMVVASDPSTLNKTSYNVLLKLTLFGLILSLPLVFFIRWLSKRITAPLHQLTQLVSEITGANDLTKRLELNTGDEIGTLATNFNQMTSRLESESSAHREAELRLRSTIDNAMDAIVQINSEGVVTGWNTQAENIFGWNSQEAIGHLLQELIIPPQYREDHDRGMKHLNITGEGSVLNSRIELTSIHRNGREFPIELTITSIEVAGKNEFSAFIRDITSKKESEDTIWKQANYDKVTGLPNRHMFHDRLEQEIKKAHRASLHAGLLFIDLDRFKEINDTLGHDMGDILLKEASQRICSCVRESDTVARLGGDEFTVILSEVDDPKIVERISQSILKLLSDPFQLGDEVAYISGSIGITLYPNDATGVEELLKNADQAMYVAKDQGRNQFSYFTPALQEAAQERRRLANDLRFALSAKQFIVYFQPIVDLKTGHIHKAEALIRWQHPERGLVSPASFIQIAEETGLIINIGDWVFREAARWAKHWSEKFGSDFQISVNVSPVQFLSEEHSCAAWGEYLKGMGLKGRSIVVEITEGLLLKAAANVTDKLLEFRDSGIEVAIDDFGTGYSSLSYLKEFDIDYLKIDKSFVDNLKQDSNDLALSEAIIVMAHKLGLKVIAEGVETKEQLDLLKFAGCDFAQGYLLSKPVPPESFELLLSSTYTDSAS